MLPSCSIPIVFLAVSIVIFVMCFYIPHCPLHAHRRYIGGVKDVHENGHNGNIPMQVVCVEKNGVVPH
jgi:hypothetical protein